LGGATVDDTLRWGRLPGESDAAYSAFIAYRDMPAPRSLIRVGQELGKSGGLCERWSSRHEWAERCRAWDNHLQRERDKVAIREARKWERRRQQELESNWETVQAIRAKLDKMLAFPLQRTETSKDGQTVIIEPIRWSFQTVALLARTAAEIGAAVLLAVGSDPDELTEAQARAILDDLAEGES
jgi:virulence-associated protein VagC